MKYLKAYMQALLLILFTSIVTIIFAAAIWMVLAVLEMFLLIV